uniref:Uncharacterized protein n=1 Tax=Pyrodinium bahamense TaxID=73915 RepID=A0A7S0AXC0_9DINO|mmetsp:Transcript_43497/g.120875  ORF Transcript_43497/g.120875 Transcript_43497/m.120875 type:complete len:253 (+) Transcript_43497:23-781(+)
MGCLPNMFVLLVLALFGGVSSRRVHDSLKYHLLKESPEDGRCEPEERTKLVREMILPPRHWQCGRRCQNLRPDAAGNVEWFRLIVRSWRGCCQKAERLCREEQVCNGTDASCCKGQLHDVRISVLNAGHRVCMEDGCIAECLSSPALPCRGRLCETYESRSSAGGEPGTPRHAYTGAVDELQSLLADMNLTALRASGAVNETALALLRGLASSRLGQYHGARCARCSSAPRGTLPRLTVGLAALAAAVSAGA